MTVNSKSSSEFTAQYGVKTERQEKGKKSERAGPHPIGQKGQLVKRSQGPKS